MRRPARRCSISARCAAWASLLAGSPTNTGDGARPGGAGRHCGGRPITAVLPASISDPAHQADLALLLTDPANAGKVQQVYTTQLAAWLSANYPTLTQDDGALAAFRTLAPDRPGHFRPRRVLPGTAGQRGGNTTTRPAGSSAAIRAANLRSTRCFRRPPATGPRIRSGVAYGLCRRHHHAERPGGRPRQRRHRADL